MMKKQLEKLYIEHNRELYLYAVSLCRNHHQAQDLVSETFFKALITLNEETPYFKYWLFRVCKNLHLDRVRNYKENSIIDDIVLATKETPLDKIIDNEERNKLFQLILNLRPAYREIIVLYYYSDFSLREIAEHTGITEGSAKTLLFRARKKLKAGLEVENEL